MKCCLIPPGQGKTGEIPTPLSSADDLHEGETKETKNDVYSKIASRATSK